MDRRFRRRNTAVREGEKRLIRQPITDVVRPDVVRFPGSRRKTSGVNVPCFSFVTAFWGENVCRRRFTVLVSYGVRGAYTSTECPRDDRSSRGQSSWFFINNNIPIPICIEWIDIVGREDSSITEKWYG